MKTELIGRGEIERAASFIKEGGLVAFPTETVYGLGANACDDNAVRLIFAVKRRPIVNPLIVHVDSIEKARELTSYIGRSALRLMQKFTPGPITFVLKSAGRVSRFACGGLDSVAIRIPKNPVALDLIKMSGVPIAAPSANLSRRPSATNFEMAYRELNGLVKGIIKYDVSLNIGIESTVVSFTESDDVLILRPGAVTREAIQESLGKEVSVDYALGKAAAASPGNLLQHYRPRIPVYLFNGQDNIRKYMTNRYTKVLITRDTLNSYWFNKFYSMVHNICVYNTLEEYAASIYREFVDSEKRYKQILAEYTHNSGLGYSINNRLMKASLNKFISN
ncbi:L-threonylcarbamoyladenylate synthase [Borrelia sp. BU AG58]|uniref:L-threonylcarbamoyladenylate synthase n=1 Tax=Borrelia sp. BU AG58 TaxID=2887345 RepID=UPI001E4F0F09|nr:L-threonylcarbamoyladenylate synthase [Borrelia sp. BU AG58]UER67880.1 L-threonylcarbamoyladenylate synthase [Borrelia sp. BU AG58]